MLTIYCSGGVRKSTDPDGKLCWGECERRALAEPLGMPVRFVDPEAPLDDLSDFAALFGRDLYGVQIADAVVVDARQRRGLGIGIEMAAAKLYAKPLVAVVPRDSHYHSTRLAMRGGVVNDYVHPHVRGLCDEIVPDFAAAGRWLATHLTRRSAVKGAEALDEAVAAYKQRLLASDSGMPQPTAS
jgi:hypothetical protein